MFSNFFHSKELKARAGALREAEIALSNAVEEYMQSITQGDHALELPEIDWDAKDEASYIKRLLSPVSEYFNDLSPPPSLEVGILGIAHLLASLTILKEMSGVNTDDRLKKLERMGIMTQVQAGMPGPCMIYIHALLRSSKYDAISKINLLGDVINSINDNINTFGALGSTILTFALNEWFTIFNGLNAKVKTTLSKDKEKHRALQKMDSQKEEMTFVDQCILQVWNALSIDVSIGLMKEVSPAPSEFPSPFGTKGSL